jgi:hypothetical protein
VLTVAVVNELVRDPAFEPTIRNGVQADASAALAAFWRRADFAPLARGLDVPHATWPTITGCLSWLLKGNGPGDRELWERVALASEPLADASPIAASIAALYALARWEGALGGDLLREAYFQGRYQLAPGWETIPLATARTLHRAGAIWATRYLAQTAVETIEMSPSWAGQGRDPEATAGYRMVLRHAQRRFDECIDNLAWDLRQSCSAGQPNFRPEVAAMFWSLGDVPHAELMRRSAFVPSRAVVSQLVQRSLVVIPFDPGLQAIWLQLKDRPPFALRSHKELFSSINLYWADIPLHLMRGLDAGQHQVDAVSLYSQPSRAYAAAATEYFGAGITPQTLAELGETHEFSSGLMMRHAPEALIRIRSLLTLAVPDARPPDVPASAERWRILAEAACATVQARERGLRDSYDRVLDIPFYYLDRAALTGLTEAIELAERYRQAGMWFWRLVTPVSARAPDPAVQQLIGRARDVVAELHARRFLGMIPYLPARAAILDVAVDQGTRIYPARPKDVEALARSAFDRINELAGELDDVAEQIARADPEFAATRRAALSPIEDFAATLSPA